MTLRTLFPLAAILAASFAGSGCNYNSLVQKDEAVDQSWADVQSQYQRRADLVPNLVSTVRGAANFEQETLTAVTQARANATGIQLSADDLSDPAKVQQFQAAQSQLSGALSRLLVVSENYPELRATESFQTLQAQLEGTENRINVSRDRYNNTVADYNTSVRSFPSSLYAGWFGFERRTPFEADAASQRAPTVNFGS